MPKLVLSPSTKEIYFQRGGVCTAIDGRAVGCSEWDEVATKKPLTTFAEFKADPVSFVDADTVWVKAGICLYGDPRYAHWYGVYQDIVTINERSSAHLEIVGLFLHEHAAADPTWLGHAYRLCDNPLLSRGALPGVGQSGPQFYQGGR
ncbi:hypothetical protein GF380_00570 [Candidatus Uhrbacteria bacterium]|nr:hypothetical protein [Candidatus Uhrbacteria bacterium]